MSNRILIAEDEPTSLKLLKDFLSPYGEVHAVLNGADAIQAVREVLHNKESYDLICLDMMMPKLGGIEALSAIRKLEDRFGLKKENKQQVLIVSSVAEKAEIVRAAQSGCNGYLIKPVRKAAIEGRLKALGMI